MEYLPGTGASKVIAKLMYEAYKQIMSPPSHIDWDYAERWFPELQYSMENWKKLDPYG